MSQRECKKLPKLRITRNMLKRHQISQIEISHLIKHGMGLQVRVTIREEINLRITQKQEPLSNKKLEVKPRMAKILRNR
jgi:hypothetical protein